MTIQIEAVDYVQDATNISTIHLGSTAARTAIDKSRLSDENIGLLINTGTYRDHNLCEPAEAALMQKAAGLNGDIRREVADENGNAVFEPVPGTLSFDILNGACGLFSALEVMETFVGNGAVDGGVIISANVHPSMTDRQDFPFTPLGSAMVVGPAQDGSGFSKIKGYTMNNYDTPGITADFHVNERPGKGREEIDITIDAGFEDSLVQFVTEKGLAYLAAGGIGDEDIDYIVTTEYSGSFLNRVAEGLGLSPAKCLSIYSEMGNTHSSAPIVALTKPELQAKGKKVLFIGAGSGLTCYFALYQT